MDTHINNPMALFPQMSGQAVLVGEIPLVVMQQSAIVWTTLENGQQVSSRQLEVLDTIGRMYPDMQWHMDHETGRYALVCLDPSGKGHVVIKPNGAYQWHLPNGPVIEIGPGEDHPFTNI